MMPFHIGGQISFHQAREMAERGGRRMRKCRITTSRMPAGADMPAGWPL